MRKLFAALFAAMMLLSAAGYCEEAVIGGYHRGYTYVTFGEYYINNGDAKESVLWRVLDSDVETAYLLSEYILLAHRVHDVQEYPGWEKSELYSFLNDELLSEMFSSREAEALVKNEDGGLITLLSADEMRKEEYGFGSDGSREARGTKYAKEKTRLNQFDDTRSPWWSRNVSQDYDYMQRYVMDGGKLGRAIVTNERCGVRPAIRVTLGMLSFAGGTGTKDDPYVLSAAEKYDGAVISAVTPTPAPTPVPTPSPVPDLPHTPDEEAKSPGEMPTGILPPGSEDYIYSDDREGRWIYASEKVFVDIARLSVKGEGINWLEAEIILDAAKTRLGAFDPDGSYDDFIIAFSSDGHAARKASGLPAGIIIRDGETKYSENDSLGLYPPLDLIAFFEDGMGIVYESGKTSADNLENNAAVNSFACGPALIKDGEICLSSSLYSLTRDGRCAIGVAGPGHYHVIVTSEGDGVNARWLAMRLRDLGCREAIALDSGEGAFMSFMGQRLNTPVTMLGTEAPAQDEIIGIIK